MNEIKSRGFSSEDEAKFLARLEGDVRRVNLEQELKTQIAEDFGLIQFTLKYDFYDGRLVDKKSKQSTVELTERGGIEEETSSIKKIERGLLEQPDSIWIHFSPANKKLGYPSNCVDFWRRSEGGEVIWNRIVVEDGFERMNEVRTFLSEEEKVSDEMEILGAPIKTELKLCELFDLFKLSELKNACTMEFIESVVKAYTDEFESKFGETLTDDSETIFRLYSSCYTAIKRGQNSGELLSRRQLDLYMFGQMNRIMEVESFGCAATTTIGEFGEKVGYYILDNGQVKYGEIPDGYKECKKCGCWYSGESCPFC